MHVPDSRVIVLVEDDSTMAWVLSKVIAQSVSGYTVQVCQHGQEALDYLALHGACCVITDYLMPHMNGLTLARSIANQSPTMPIILITGGRIAQIQDEAQMAGCLVVLEKPVLPATLHTVMQSVLAARDKEP